VDDLCRQCRIGPGARVLEIGCGTGQLTRDLAVRGAAIRCVEAGGALAGLARAELAGYSNVEVVTGLFERFEDGPRSYEAVVSATAFHWIDPNVSFAKAHDLLRPGGRLALLTHEHASGGNHTDEAFTRAVSDLQRRVAPELGDWTFTTTAEVEDKAAAGGDLAAVWARVERRLWDPPSISGLFDDPVVATYPWIATYDRETYLAMLGSQSAYATMDQSRREALLAGIDGLIREHLGDVVTKEYVTVLAVAVAVAAFTGTS
jgi:SAM-dependent methyltransferase